MTIAEKEISYRMMQYKAYVSFVNSQSKRCRTVSSAHGLDYNDP